MRLFVFRRCGAFLATVAFSLAGASVRAHAASPAAAVTAKSEQPDSTSGQSEPASEELLVPAAAEGGGAELPAASDSPQTHRFRLHSEIQALGFSHVHPVVDGFASAAGSGARPPLGAGDDINAFGVGVGRLRDVDGRIPLWSIGFAAKVAPHVSVGARGGLRLDRDRTSDTDVIHRGLAGKLVPYVQYMFAPKGRIVPYLEGRFGMVGARAVTRTRGEMGATTKVDSMGPVVGVGGGIHMFFHPQLSIGFGGDLDYHAQFGRGVLRQGDTNTKSSWRRSADMLDIGATVALSIWL